MPRNSKAAQRREARRHLQILEAVLGIGRVPKRRRRRDGETMFDRQWLPDVMLPDGSSIIHIGSVLEMKWVGKNQAHCARYMERNLSGDHTQMHIIMSPTFKVVLTLTVVRQYQVHNRFLLDECVLKLNKRPSAEQENMLKAWILVEPLRQEIRDRMTLDRLTGQIETAYRWYEGLEAGQPVRPPPPWLF